MTEQQLFKEVAEDVGSMYDIEAKNDADKRRIEAVKIYCKLNGSTQLQAGACLTKRAAYLGHFAEKLAFRIRDKSE